MAEPKSERARYEHLRSLELIADLSAYGQDRIETKPLDSAHAADRAALYAYQAIRSTLDQVPENVRPAVAIQVINGIVEQLKEIHPEIERKHVPEASQVLALGLLRPTGEVDFPTGPLTPLLDSSLHTNAKQEPSLITQLLSEFDSADRVDIIMAFVLKTGVSFLLNPIAKAVQRGCEVRLLTTTYLNSTEASALEALIEAGAEVKVSYDKSLSRLHAKSWIFHRRGSISTAYVGSSNLSMSAQVTGMEWNVRLSGARNPDVVRRMSDVFNTYWSHDLFKAYNHHEFEHATLKARSLSIDLAGIAGITLRPFQEAMLDQIAAAREWGQRRNLLVSATGTGKTVMAAVDYSRLREQGLDTLLFIAHRKEILDQSLMTFRQAVGDFSFGQKWYGGASPTHDSHVFASIQSMTAGTVSGFDPSHFDVVIIDEFHHAAAPTYQTVLNHFNPRELLALTATPERSDGQDVLALFDGTISAELRLWDAIDQEHLVPFHYFGISDGTDLTEINYSPSKGYDITDLSNVYTGNHVWAGLVLKNAAAHLNLDTVRALGFCVSVDHATFMAAYFNDHGVPAAVVTGGTPAEERAAALQGLRNGELRFVFSVDVFNEGVDVPNVDAILMMRPTESPVIFLQQLGRGLRRAPNKPLCTVLDFVGTHRQEFRFDRKFAPLLGASRATLAQQVESGFPYLPSGCFMHLDEVASETVINSIKNALPTTQKALTSALQACANEIGDPTLTDFLEHSGVSLNHLFARSRSWSDLRQAVGLPIHPMGPHEKELRRAVTRLLHVDDPVRTKAYRAVALGDTTVAPQLKRMLLTQLFSQVGSAKGLSVTEAHSLLLDHPQVCAELIEVVDALAGTASHPHQTLNGVDGLPLMVHGRYTRSEIQAAYGIGEGTQVNLWQSGVLWVPNWSTDLLAFTIDKSAESFSPTTSYNDFALSPRMIHWESQSTTSETSATGKRYQKHQELGSTVMLFGRQRRDERAFWFLGPGSYIRHTGSKPMAIDWKLEFALPAELYQDLSIIAA